MSKLFQIRDKVFALLEKARRDGSVASLPRATGFVGLNPLLRNVKSSLSADVALNITSATAPDVIDLLGREGASGCCY